MKKIVCTYGLGYTQFVFLKKLFYKKVNLILVENLKALR